MTRGKAGLLYPRLSTVYSIVKKLWNFGWKFIKIRYEVSYLLYNGLASLYL